MAGLDPAIQPDVPRARKVFLAPGSSPGVTRGGIGAARPSIAAKHQIVIPAFIAGIQAMPPHPRTYRDTPAEFTLPKSNRHAQSRTP